MDFATRFRPQKISEIFGQTQIVNIFTKFIQTKKIPHSLFFGAPGCGKTTLAKIIANEMRCDFFSFDAANFKIEQLRSVIGKGLLKPLIFIDEFHRLSKTQQEALLIPVENADCLLFGATTENPKFSISGGLRSRMLIFEFKPLSDEDLRQLLKFVRTQIEFEISDDALDYLIRSSNGDARAMLNLLDFAFSINKNIDLPTLKTLRPTFVGEGANSKDTHYDIISAFIKSVRGSDVDAALYYLARLLAAGEDPTFLARRMVILSSEDIGNANPNALNLAVSTMTAVSKIGMPEARIILAQCVIFLACCPKSNVAYLAIDKALECLKTSANQQIPKHIINSSEKIKAYKYPHDFGGWCEQQYLPNELKNAKFYESKMIAFEKILDEWNNKIRA